MRRRLSALLVSFASFRVPRPGPITATGPYTTTSADDPRGRVVVPPAAGPPGWRAATGFSETDLARRLHWN